MIGNRCHAGIRAFGLLVGLLAGLPAATAQMCTADQLAGTVDQVGAALRRITAETQPRIDAKIRDVMAKRGWSGVEGDEQVYAALTDTRGAALDQTVNELLARVDSLGQLSAGAVPECGRITDLEATGLELQAAVRARTLHSLNRLEALLTEAPTATVAADPAVPSAAPPAPAAAAPAAAAPAASTAAPAARPVPVTPPAAAAPVAGPAVAAPSPWTTTVEAAGPQTPPPVPGLVPDDEGYSIDDLKAASRGVFGQLSANLATVFEHAFARSGRPTAYVLGQETGGAFFAGLRYGRGTLYLRSGQSLPIYWHGPSLGFDVGASGTQVMFLVYRLRDADQLLSPFAAVEGSAFVAGGVGLTLMSNGDVQVAPVRSGVGLRLGANVGYVRFTRRQTWNPF
jgi:hypothetical protein